MADIFISYSKPDRDKVVMLAAYLEFEGWSVWWDTSLAAGDPYRDEIMKQLATARAVIVLWTKTSINSDFVRAEAGQAKAQGKLIPVKETDVAYSDIPLPFGEMHTEELTKRELIRAAVVAQLARPQMQPSAWWIASRALRYHVLTWFGIVGGATTLFCNLQGVLNLADWASWFVANWHIVTVAFWQWAFGWIGIHLPGEWVPLLSFTVFSLMTAFGARIYIPFNYQRSEPMSYENRARRVVGAASYFIIAYPLSTVLYQFASDELDLPYAPGGRGRLGHSTVDPLILWNMLPPQLLFIFHMKGNRWHALIFSTLLSLLYFIIFVSKSIHPIFFLSNYVILVLTTLVLGSLVYCLIFARKSIRDIFVFGPTVVLVVISVFTYIYPGELQWISPEYVKHIIVVAAYGILFYVFPNAMVRLCPLLALNKRLIFLVTGLAFLIGLNELSHFAPLIRELLKPPA